MMLYCWPMADKETKERSVLDDALNYTTSGIMILVGILLFRDGIFDAELAFLLVGLLLAGVGLLRVLYRLQKGSWFNFFSRR